MKGPVPRTTIVVTRNNLQCLRVLAKMAIAEELRDGLPPLYAKLETALVVDDTSVPRDAVTVGSSVLVYDAKTETDLEVSIVYPWNAVTRKHVSVTSPLGTALLGSRIGMSLRYRDGGDRTMRVDVLDVLFQPESAAPR